MDYLYDYFVQLSLVCIFLNKNSLMLIHFIMMFFTMEVLQHVDIVVEYISYVRLLELFIFEC